MTIQKLRLVVAVLTACVGVAIAGGVALRAQPGDAPPGVPSAQKEPGEKRVGAATPQDKENPVPKNTADESARKIKDLQKERIATLKEVVQLSEVLALGARIEFGELLEARNMLLKAELDVAEKESERVTLYQETVDSLKQYEDWVNAREKAGRATKASVLKVKARRLEVEIWLEQAKMKVAKEGK